jgi:siroheme synthase-like protein
VVGAGRIAARKVAGLLDAGAEVVVVAPEAGERVQEWATEGRITLVSREFETRDVDGSWLVLTATGDPAADRRVAAAADAARVFCGTADDPALASLHGTSVLRRGDLVVAVGTGGRSPAAAAWLRRRLETELGPEYATLVELLAAARVRLQEEGRATEGADWQMALDSGMLELIHAGRVDEAEELLRACLWS